MSKQKRVLLLGGTGAMGKHLAPLLAQQGHQVDVVYTFYGECAVDAPNLHYIKADAKDSAVLGGLLSKNYDAVYDFLIHPSNEIDYYLPKILENTGQFIYFSTYRIYANEEHPIRETSPRLWDKSPDPFLKLSDDYCIYKAKGEDLLHATKRLNYTIVRPSITYSLMRYQLVTLEAHDTVGRARLGKKALLPIQAKNVQGTMTWAGDSARMLAGLLFNEKALGQTYSITTAEHRSWGEIADYYKDLVGLQVEWVDKEYYLRAISNDPYWLGPRRQLDYDRLYDRIMDNTKILEATGLKQQDFMTLYDGLKYEIGRIPADVKWTPNENMDKVIAELGL